MKLGSLRFIPVILAEWSGNMGEHDGRDVEKEEEPRIESREKTISRKIRAAGAANRAKPLWTFATDTNYVRTKLNLKHRLERVPKTEHGGEGGGPRRASCNGCSAWFTRRLVGTLRSPNLVFRDGRERIFERDTSNSSSSNRSAVLFVFHSTRNKAEYMYHILGTRSVTQRLLDIQWNIRRNIPGIFAKRRAGKRNKIVDLIDRCIDSGRGETNALSSVVEGDDAFNDVLSC